jgi:hypothetical protein
MKLLRLLLAIAAIHISFAHAQTPLPSSPPCDKKVARSLRPSNIFRRVGHTRHSMTDCHSLVDIKVTAPVLYMPARNTRSAQLRLLVKNAT